MFSRSLQAPDVPRGFLLFSILLFTALACATARAQMGGIDPEPADPGTGGKNTIQGNIYYPSGRRLDRRVRVTLTSVARADMSTMTDDSGSFSFRRLAGGTYTITVDAGKDYEVATERLEIMQAGSRRGSLLGQTFTVQMQLRLKSGGDTKSGLVNAALANVPKPALDLYLKALESAKAGDSNKAIEQLKAAIELYADFALAYNALGVQYLLSGQLDKAAGALRSAVKLAPDAFEPRLNYGIALLFMRRYKEAEAELRRAVAQNDSSAAAHAYLGRTLANQLKFDEAEKELQRGLSLGGDRVGFCYRYLGAIYKERGQKARAVEALEKYLKLYPKDKDADAIRELIRQLRAG